ncbi:MAG TPA: hypothetical protein VFS48_04510 [Solirubrobacterales bacterium]|nr:hypothetical protein [Solirubrobacterales bacterium]
MGARKPRCPRALRNHPLIEANPHLWSDEARQSFVENLAETIPGFREALVDAEIDAELEKLIEEEAEERETTD